MRRGAGRLVLGLAALLQGCAGLAASRPPLPVPVPPAGGAFEVALGRPGFVVGAPHGTSDSATDVIARELARRTGFGLVVATGFSHLDAEGRRYNVNRPTESVPGTPARLEVETEAAWRVFEAYRQHVARVAQGPLRLYVEVHGNGHRASARRVEIATVGLDRDEAWRVKTLLELVRDARLDGPADPAYLEVWVEALDPVRYTASAAKQGGMLGASERALHIELPKTARTAHQALYVEVLADFLAQSASLLAAREQ